VTRDGGKKQSKKVKVKSKKLRKEFFKNIKSDFEQYLLFLHFYLLP